ncbi:MAG: lycopene cyclase [Comamonadaceae bacterium]|nr:MAG: lycopene cyclase [Comamonadaceae bacterium]
MSPHDPSAGAPSAKDADLILVGGGLANALIAWRLRERRPDLRVTVLEQGDTLGGNHTWSFHGTDVSAAQLQWLEPLIGHRWPGHEVRFPKRQRTLRTPYFSIVSRQLHEVLAPAVSQGLRLNTSVCEVKATSVRLHDGRRLHAGAVIDGRGPRMDPHLDLGFQTFVGWELRTRQPHGMRLPVLMDAQVPQEGGYRFMYVLPLADDVLLVEDTCYSDDASVDHACSRDRIRHYVRAQGWQMQALLREEHGVLPILLGGDVEALWSDSAAPARSGLAAALFHPTTGYSLPEAVSLAWMLAELPDLRAPALHAAVRAHAQARWRAGAFFRLLNRMLFRAAGPAQRRVVMERFYGLNTGLIERFYAGRPSWVDCARILSGRPPVPLGAAWRAAFSRPAAPPAAASSSVSVP